MGYRSNVAYTIRFTTEEAYRLFILEAKAKELGGCFSDDTSNWDEAECNDERWRIDFRADDVKWYESYPDVEKHEALLQLAREWAESDTHNEIKDGGAGYDAYRIGFSFVRVGEDSNDITEEYGGNAEWDWLSVRREIVTS